MEDTYQIVEAVVAKVGDLKNGECATIFHS